MKPLMLKITGFQAYGGTEVIDFQKMGGSGLFLVTGNTGAGKTTIFDAMTFALYGKTSGSDRPNEAIRSHFADSKVDTNVELAFQHRGKKYIVARNPAHERPKASGRQGTVTRAKDATLIIPNSPVVTGDSAVTKEIESIIGLEYKQWTQVIMLAQGEFVKLLNADSKERSDILQKIFQTQIYRAIQENLKTKYSESKQGLDELQGKVFMKINEVECGEESEYYGAASEMKSNFDRIHDADGVLRIFGEIIEDDSKNASRQSEKLNESKGKRDALFEEKAHAASLIKDFEELEELNTELLTSNEKKNDIDALKSKLERSEKALNFVKPVYDNFKGTENRMGEKQTQFSTLNREIEELNPKLERLTAEWQLKKLEAEALPEIIVKIADIDAALPKYSELTKKSNNLAKANIELNDLNTKKAGFAREKETKDSDKREHIKFVNAHLDLKKNLQTVRLSLQNYTAILEKANGLDKVLKEYYSKKAEADQIRKNCQGLVAKVQEESGRLAAAEQLFYNSQAVILAGTLKEGVSCPVCGSTHHPSIAVAVGNVPTEENIRQIKSKKEEAEAKNLEARTSLASAEGQLMEMESQISDGASQLNISMPDLSDEKECMFQILKTIGDLEEKVNGITTECHSLEELEEEFDSRSEILRTLDDEADALDQKISEIEPSILAKSEEVSALTANVQSISDGLTYSSETDALAAKQVLTEKRDSLSHDETKAQEAWNSINSSMIQKKAESTTVNETLAEVQGELDRLKSELDKALSKQNFVGMDEFISCLMERDDLDKKKKEVLSFESDYGVLVSKISSLSSKLEGKEKPDLESIEEKLGEIEADILTIDSEKSTVESRLKNNVKVRNNLEGQFSEKELAERQNTEIKAMSDTANGTLAGSEKITFEQYVQGVYFDEVVNRASKRLGLMTNNRFVLLRKKQAEDLRSKTSLDVEVLDNHSGRTRSVKSLSGGESFKAALSLALGLSDMIQTVSGGVDIETLFIDEGFGSLDAVSLDQAIMVLEQLSDSNTLIGIISHVDSLKERLNRKIIVTHDEKGSRAEIVVD